MIALQRFVCHCRKLGAQISALIGGAIIILFAGQHLAWGIFDHRVINHMWYRKLLPQAFVWHFRAVVIWFLAIMPGLYVGARLVRSHSKFSIYSVCLTMAFASSLLLAALPENIGCILVARLLAGMTYGIGYIAILMHATEMAEKEMRGTLVSLIHMITFLGVFLSSTLNASPTDMHTTERLDFNRMFGVTAAAYITVGAGLMLLLHKESPAGLTQCQREQRREDESVVAQQSNRLSLFYIVVLRIAHACTFNMPLNIILLLTASRVAFAEANLTEMILSLVRYLMSLLMVGLIDLWRRQFALISTFMSAFLMLTISLLTYLYGIDYPRPSYVVVAGLLLQIFASMGVKIHADILSVECFDSTQKPQAIAKTALVENIVQILFLVTYFHSNMRVIEFALGTMTTLLALTFGMVILAYPSASDRRVGTREKKIVRNESEEI